MNKCISVCIAIFFAYYLNGQTFTLPLGGNAWVLDKTSGIRVRNSGVANWTQEGTGFTVYLRIAQPELMKMWMEAENVDDASVLSVSVFGSSREVVLKAGGNEFFIGEWNIKDSGYVPIVFKSIRKDGSNYPNVKSLRLEGSALNGNVNFTKNNEGNFFHWGRRGPSVHMNYQLPKDVDAEWFYNEVTVPEGNDVIGSYFMANGFGEGYFGMQVNSPTERRVLFSVWSPYQTDDPKSIPEDQKIHMLKKGADVYTGEFGNEGSGGQSFLKYSWKANQTQKFLLHVLPDGDAHTIYTAYFFDHDKNNWRLIASFRRPKLATYLKRPHSFLENFSPDMGDVERKVYFGNQWVCDSKGNWHELTNAIFSADNTARIGYRKDYDGGAKGNQFYLRNCGFFNDYTNYGVKVERLPTHQKPAIDLTQLP